MNGTKAPAVTATWGAEGGRWAVIVHGGAGGLVAELDSHRADEHAAGCRAAAHDAAEALRSGLGALDAVERAVRALEANPVFNAGTGACLNEEGLIELDAAIMEGEGLRAGAVCALPPFRHPVAIARAALEDGRHVLYAAEGAARFAVERGFERATSEAMTTEWARSRWLARTGLGGVPAGDAVEGRGGERGGGTVGAVARDARGNVAAATSTGGLLGKRGGRVGDSPLLGAGTYADNAGGACSATGQGEAIMRLVLAKTAIDAMRAGEAPEATARGAIHALGNRLGGAGGVILVDRAGRIGWARNTPSMAWAAVGEGLVAASGI